MGAHGCGAMPLRASGCSCASLGPGSARSRAHHEAAETRRPAPSVGPPAAPPIPGGRARGRGAAPTWTRACGGCTKRCGRGAPCRATAPSAAPGMSTRERGCRHHENAIFERERRYMLLFPKRVSQNMSRFLQKSGKKGIHPHLPVLALLGCPVGVHRPPPPPVHAAAKGRRAGSEDRRLTSSSADTCCADRRGKRKIQVGFYIDTDTIRSMSDREETSQSLW